MKSLMLLWQKIADESAIRCCTSATRDGKTVTRRVEHEGLSFLTITLPQFGKDFERSLDQGAVSRSLFQGFTWRAGLPQFLGGFLENVFDRKSGELIDDPCVDSVLAVRQLTLMFSKIHLKCSDAREEDAMQGYIDCENDVKRAVTRIKPEDRNDFRRVSALLFGRVFGQADREVHHTRLLPKHGPGATADKLRGNAKYRQRTWPMRLEKALPSSSFLFPSPSFEEEMGAVDIIEPEAEEPVKVISVPKTLKTPRIIGVEPTCMQYAQQAILPVVLDALSRDDFLDNIIGFDDQVPNQELAREGSLNGELATLDLSEASDRVANELVLELFRDHPQLNEVVQATRSRKARVPGKGVHRLAKFASMGSALCFPVEAMVFTTLVFIGIERALSSPLGWEQVKNLFTDQVRVYGDDIIVPVEYVQSVVSTLQAFGLVVNEHKSFWNGKFRESCGKEYFDGHDVSIVKVRELFPTHRRHATGVISTVSLRNQLYFAGYWETCKWLDERIKEVITYFPTVLPTSPVQGRHSFLGFETQRIGDKLHNPLVKGYRVSATPPPDPLEGHGALLKCFLNKGDMPIADEKHLRRAGRPKSVNIKLGWCSAV